MYDQNHSYHAVVYFKNLSHLQDPKARGRKFTSRDFSSSKSKTRNPQLGLKRLFTMIEQKFKGKYDTAIIYDSISGQEVHKYRDGVKMY